MGHVLDAKEFAVSDDNSRTYKDGDRVTHKVQGLGTVRTEPAAADLVLSRTEEAKTGSDMIYVVWDDDRYPVGKVPADEIEPLPPGAEAISTGV